MANEFIEKIEIEKFKCFNNFKAGGFKRINLIGGRNNVGKTTLLEACLLSMSANLEELYGNFLAIKTTRDVVNVMDSNYTDDIYIRKLIDQKELNISANNNVVSYKLQDDKYVIQCLNEKYQKTYTELDDFIKIKRLHAKWVAKSDLLSINVIYDGLLKILIDSLKKTNKYDELNEYLKDVFNIYNIDIIDDEPNIKKIKDGNYMPISSFGQGLKSFINIIASLLDVRKYIFIDEIENGIHYTLHDKMWEIIFKISKKEIFKYSQQHIQKNALSHMIESQKN